ncbi:A/G-specific adenine glycosylase [Candidatus Cardinium hertigii]|uniref:Adenine DNA glycosylase n=1 Tax=Candidatus Cardinium hertigii TaxID=247481 RepID=A0A2Z3LI42_9BACT|nr:A/G-specific adenine glycosylase [Candidatus Cardinium hertigii]AWN82195.1 Adenine DNA glycosylase [Candidatus Cardinium hertigii]
MLATPIDPILFRKLLLGWYAIHQRCLPWRATKDPYKIWLSEIILQQTRVVQGLPYYERLVAQYPTLSVLAHATEQEVLRSWQGLGYYSRARNLHQCAKTVVQQYQGEFPNNYRTLLTLKGIGPYTAAAIASIAFKEVVAAVDGNVYRVLARIFGLAHDISTLQGKKYITQLATALVDPLYPDRYSQAIMDFGALQCTPSLPLCATCVFQSYCNAFHSNRQHILPVKTAKIHKRKRYFDYIMVAHGDTVFMKKRTHRGIWQNMYDFHLVENSQRLTLDQMQDALLNLLQEHRLPIVTFTEEVTHLLTHQTLLIKFHKVEVSLPFLQMATACLTEMALEPFATAAVEALPKPIVIQKFLQKRLLEKK